MDGGVGQRYAVPSRPSPRRGPPRPRRAVHGSATALAPPPKPDHFSGRVGCLDDPAAAPPPRRRALLEDLDHFGTRLSVHLETHSNTGAGGGATSAGQNLTFRVSLAACGGCPDIGYRLLFLAVGRDDAGLETVLDGAEAPRGRSGARPALPPGQMLARRATSAPVRVVVAAKVPTDLLGVPLTVLRLPLSSVSDWDGYAYRMRVRCPSRLPPLMRFTPGLVRRTL